jgi:hypothetical protein
VNSTSPETDNSPKLGWRFWIVLLTPPLVAAAANALVTSANLRGTDGLGITMMANVFSATVLNLICSLIAGRLYAAYHSSYRRVSQSLGWALLFFILNIGLCFGGCALGAAVGNAVK